MGSSGLDVFITCIRLIILYVLMFNPKWSGTCTLVLMHVICVTAYNAMLFRILLQLELDFSLPLGRTACTNGQIILE